MSESEELSLSYHNMRLNKIAWEHMFKTIEDAREKCVHNAIDCKSVEELNGAMAGYVKGVRQCADIIKSSILNALSGGDESNGQPKTN